MVFYSGFLQHETINRDKGVDFANRLKGLRVFDLGKDEAAVTTATLSQEEAIKKEMQEFNPSYITAVNDLFTYIKTVNEIIKTRDELKKLESTYQSVRDWLLAIIYAVCM